jgi:hypothetical protein
MRERIAIDLAHGVDTNVSPDTWSDINPKEVVGSMRSSITRALGQEVDFGRWSLGELAYAASMVPHSLFFPDWLRESMQRIQPEEYGRMLQEEQEFNEAGRERLASYCRLS